MNNIKKLILITSFILLFFIVLLGVYTVFSVNYISVYYSVSSDVGKAYAEEIQIKLDENFHGKNIFFIREKKISAVFDDFPYIKEVSIRKVYPNKIIVYAEEEPEFYAVYDNEGYCMLGEDGSLLAKRAENENYADGYTNVLLENFSYESGEFSDKEIFSSVCRMGSYMNEAFGGIRSNVKRIVYVTPTSSRADEYFEIYMTEGVVVKIVAPLSNADEKIARVCEFYLSLNTEEKMYGVITAIDLAESEGVSVTYTSRYGEVRN